MGVQIEMGFFLLALLLGFRQIHQFTEAQRRRPTKFESIDQRVGRMREAFSRGILSPGCRRSK
jgi:hypothetical protein